eukprot:CAMPEP_0180351744 /NCGR_PEP_ID=MMETSP0989-20121125/6690_1 /TAXON_ID=697907 /ORGANISM="non described non described, Strain CCMP2293" /LENGTH=105 /DNA_ID=CAMNT_0022341203 /DNA_START=107 /DNA_END=424 /DNA_ORIENTATION=-
MPAPDFHYRQPSPRRETQPSFRSSKTRHRVRYNSATVPRTPRGPGRRKRSPPLLVPRAPFGLGRTLPARPPTRKHNTLAGGNSTDETWRVVVAEERFSSATGADP